MGQSVYVEWVNGATAERLYLKRREKAARDFIAMHPQTQSPYATDDSDSWWDWVDIDECYENRAFPSVAMAKAWVEKNYKRDLYESPRIYKNEWPDGEDWNVETTVKLEFDGVSDFVDLE